MKTKLVLLAGVLASLTIPAFADPTPISTINGLYGQNEYDTAELTISNTTSFAFTNVELTLTGYQGLNNGVIQSQFISNVAAGTTLDYFWGQNDTGSLFQSDYDDEYGSYSNPPNSVCTIDDTQYGVSQYYWCADVGNFYVTLTATWNSQQIYSQFSPTTNATGSFVGWEGLDPNGWAETSYDDHSPGGPNGVLANIYEGTPPPINPPGPAPEPSSFVLLGSGLAGLIGVARRRFAA
jgi:hypothetical protein